MSNRPKSTVGFSAPRFLRNASLVLKPPRFVRGWDIHLICDVFQNRTFLRQLRTTGTPDKLLCLSFFWVPSIVYCLQGSLGFFFWFQKLVRENKEQGGRVCGGLDWVSGYFATNKFFLSAIAVSCEIFGAQVHFCIVVSRLRNAARSFLNSSRIPSFRILIWKVIDFSSINTELGLLSQYWLSSCVWTTAMRI